MDYVSLNDGYNDEILDPPKRRRKESHQPRSAPSATRVSAHKRMSSPESMAPDGDPPKDTFSAVPSTAIPSTSADGDTLVGIPIPAEQLPITLVDNETLIGIQTGDKHLPDLVPSQPANVQGDTLLGNIGNTEEELEVASTLLSLGDTLDDTLAEEDENALLMPIGGTRAPLDIAPQPLRLDQVSVDNVIAGLLETEQLDKNLAENKPDLLENLPAENTTPMDPLLSKQVQLDANAVKKGTLETKTYVLKKKSDSKRTFKCSECKILETSIQKLNEHHQRIHNPQMCGICNKTFA